MLESQICDTMIRQQLRTTGTLDECVLQVIRETPREAFVPKAYRDFAYADFNIPLAHEQQMLYPEAEALILQSLAIQATDHVFEVGTGTGYFTALLAQLGGQVESVDIYQDFIDAARTNGLLQKYRNIVLSCADAADGPLNMGSTYDVIVISGALHLLPPNYLNALKPGGRLVAIIGVPQVMDVVLYKKTETGLLQKRLLETVTPYLVNAQTVDSFRF